MEGLVQLGGIGEPSLEKRRELSCLGSLASLVFKLELEANLMFSVQDRHK